MPKNRDWREFNNAWRKPGSPGVSVAKETRFGIMLVASIGLMLAATAGWLDPDEHVLTNGAVLKDADLHGAWLRNAYLVGADLEDTNFNNADLSNADLSHAHLRGANLARTRLNHVNFAGTDLTNAILSEADIANATSLSQQQLDRACGDKNTRLPEGLTIPMC